MRTKSTITHPCLHCGTPFTTESYKIKYGKGKYCSVTCSGLAHRRGETVPCVQCGTPFYRDAAKAKVGRKYCSEHCSRLAHSGAGHHAWKGSPSHTGSHGYKQFADGSLEHRNILLALIGDGSHPCHWCGQTVTWSKGARTKPGALIVDHVDEDKSNNAPENLVPSCHRCNVRRSNRTLVRDDETFIVDTLGRRIRAVIKPCEHCQTPFLARCNQIVQGKGRFCSRSCAGAHPWAQGAAWTVNALSMLDLGRQPKRKS